MKQSRFNHMAVSPSGGTVLYNFYTGKCAHLNFLTKDYYDHPEIYGLEHPGVKRLIDAGFLVDYDELDYLRTVMTAECGKTDCLCLVICPTLQCNFACPYCYESAHGGKMNEEVQNQVIDFAERMINIGHPKFMTAVWYGGEPLLESDIIRSLSAGLIGICQKEKVKYRGAIVTNGYRLTPELSEMFEECRIRSMQITLDGPDADSHNATRHLQGGEGSFDRIMENIRQFRADCEITVRCNIYDGNADRFPELEEKLKKIGSETGKKISIYAGHMDGHNSYTSNEIPMRDFVEFQKKILKGVSTQKYHGPVCTEPRTFDFVIDERGNLYKCWESVGKHEESFGNVKDYIPDNPQTCRVPVLMDNLHSGWPDDEECLQCPVLPVCLGGCPARRKTTGKQCISLKYAMDDYILEVDRELQINGKY